MTNQEKFIQVFGIDAWRQMIVFSGLTLTEQFKEYWTSPYNEMDCRDCKEFEDCPCGKDGHENGTSQGYAIGECRDFEHQTESEDCRWIPVSEGLPETDGIYLTYIKNPYDNELSYVMLCDYIYPKWFPVDETASSNVVAWMPLPEPYKPENKTEQGLSHADQDTLMSAT